MPCHAMPGLPIALSCTRCIRRSRGRAFLITQGPVLTCCTCTFGAQASGLAPGSGAYSATPLRHNSMLTPHLEAILHTLMRTSCGRTRTTCLACGIDTSPVARDIVRRVLLVLRSLANAYGSYGSKGRLTFPVVVATAVQLAFVWWRGPSTIWLLQQVSVASSQQVVGVSAVYAAYFGHVQFVMLRWPPARWGHR